MKIRLNIENPEYISPMLVNDNLVVFFLIDVVSLDRHYLRTNPVQA
jgi:hypothetical protein